jgi:hypothetical protein
VRSANGYTLLPPSVVDGKAYEWCVGRGEPVPLPAGIREMLRAKKDKDWEPNPLDEGGDDNESNITKARMLLKSMDPRTDGFQIACQLRRDIGLSQEKAVELFDEWSSSLDWPWDYEKIWSVCRNAGRYGHGDQGQFSGVGVDGYPFDPKKIRNVEMPIAPLKPEGAFAWRTPEEAATAPPLTYWDNEKSLPKVAGILVVTGPQKSHKTGLVIKKCLDALSDGAKVLYVAAEGGYGIDTARLPAAKKQRGWTWEPLNERWRTLASPFNIIYDTGGLISDAPFIPDIVVFDTLTRVAGSADLNTSQAVQTIYAACDRLMEAWKCLVILIHHPKREGTGASGSVQIENSAYATWHIKVENETDVVCWVDKMKDGKAEFEVRYLADMSQGSPVILNAKKHEKPTNSFRYGLEQVLRKIPQGSTVNIAWVADALGCSQDTIEAHVRGRKNKKGVWVPPTASDLCAGQFLPKYVKDWEFMGLGEL